jgi:hypothetical protein
MLLASIAVLAASAVLGYGLAPAPRSAPVAPSASPGHAAGGSPAGLASPGATVGAGPTIGPSPGSSPSSSAGPSGSDTSAAGPATSIVPGEANRASLDLLATYEANVQLGFDSRQFDVETTIVITNTSGGPIDRVELNTVATRLGNLRLDASTVDGRVVTAEIDDQTIVVPLGGILPHAASTRLQLAFRATLRSGLGGSDWMFTRVNGIVDAYRWLPWVSRRTPFNRPNHGDPFVTPVSPRVRVTVTTDRPLVLATTGERTAGDGLTQTFEAGNVRDFNLTAAPDYRVTTATSDGIQVRAYTRPGGPSAATLVAQARTALAEFGERLGPYPYAGFSVSQSAGGYAVESPGLIWVPTGAPNLAYLVHHETAHQWFYGIVGSDQADEPFADEAAADFVARHVLGNRRASTCRTDALDRAIYAYSSACYYETIYIQGGNLLNDLRGRMGDTAFWAALRRYLDAHRFGIGGTRSLLETLDGGTGQDLASRYAPRFPTLR